MLDVLNRCFSQQLATQAWQERLRSLLPFYGQDLNADADLLEQVRRRSDALLGIQSS